MDLSSKETSSFNEVNIMKKRYSIGLLLVMSTMLISCGGEASSSTSSISTSPSTPSTPTPSTDTGKTGNTSSSKEEDVIGVKGQEGALYASVDLMGGKMIDLAAPFDLSYRTVNGKFGSGENADAQIVVKNATAIHKEKDGTDASASPLHALNSVFSLLQLVSSMEIVGIDLSSIPYISDLQMNAANFYNDEFDESNSYGQMNIDYKDGQNVYYYAEVTPKDETGALKNDEKTLREYAETELTLPEIPDTSKILADTLKAFVDIAFGEDGMLNKGFDMSILEALLPSFNLEDNAIAKALSVLATGLEGSIKGEDVETTGNHKTIINLGLNDTGITDANVYMNDLTGGMATLSNVSLSLEFTKVANADVSTFTGFDVTVGVTALGSLPVGIDLALKLDPTTKDLKADALDEMDEGALNAQTSYQKYKALKNKVDEYYDFSVDASYGVDAEDIIKSKGKNIELTSAYGEKIAEVGAEVEALDTYTKGLFNPETYDFVKPAAGTSSSKVYVGLAYDEGIKLLNKSKTYADSFDQADVDGLTIAGMLADKTKTEVFWEDGFNAVTLSYFKNYESSYTEAEKAKLDALMTKYASLYDEYVNVIVEDTKEESLYDSFDKIGKIIDKDCTIFDDCFTTYSQYSMFYGDNKTSIDASLKPKLWKSTPSLEIRLLNWLNL